MKFIANKFSRSVAGLLILGWAGALPVNLESSNSLKTSDLRNNEDPAMPKQRAEIPEQDRWNVAALYPDPVSWKQDFLQTQGAGHAPHWPELKAYQGQLSNPKVVVAFFDTYFALDRKLSKLHTYAHLRLDEDLGNDAFKSDYGLISSLLHDFQLESSWVEPEILSLSEAEYRHLVSHPSLSAYHFYLEKMGRMRPHMLSPELEEMMALSGKALDTAYRAFGALNNADLTFKPALDSQGKEHPLSNGSDLTYLRSAAPTLRPAAFSH